MQAERSPAGRKVVEHLMEVGARVEQRLELVDDDDEPCRAVFRQEHGVEQVPRPVSGEHALAVAELGSQARHDAVRRSRFQVGHHPDHVWQGLHRLEGGAALAVHEEQRELLRRALRGESRDPSDEQLALATPGRAADQGMGSVRPEVQQLHALDPGPDGDPERVGPPVGSRRRPSPPHRMHLREGDVGRQTRERRGLPRRECGGGERPDDVLRLGFREERRRHRHG
nr:hypothetical protein [Plantibacter sp. M259]